MVGTGVRVIKLPTQAAKQARLLLLVHATAGSAPHGGAEGCTTRACCNLTVLFSSLTIGSELGMRTTSLRVAAKPAHDRRCW